MKSLFYSVLLFLLASVICACAGMAASAEEYYSIGMAYFDIAQASTSRREEYFREAEKWLNRARQADRTMVASRYNLGRLAFEMRRYEEAAEHFEDILKRDPDNALALRAAAYTRIRTGDFAIAQRHYNRLLELVPESADDGYNHAIVLYAMGRYGEARAVLEKYPVSLHENSDVLLLYARIQSAQNNIEAINSYTAWLGNNRDAKIRYEYALLLEHHELYARALEEYRLTLSETGASSGDLRRGDIRFAIARVLLVADGENHEGITELQSAISEGFDDVEAVEALLDNEQIGASNRDSIRNIAGNMRQGAHDEQAGEPSETESEGGPG